MLIDPGLPVREGLPVRQAAKPADGVTAMLIPGALSIVSKLGLSPPGPAA